MRAHLRKAAPIIQFFVIELLTRLLEFEEESLRVWRESNIWETLFSDYFFYWGSGEKSEDMKQISGLLSSSVLNLTVYSGSLSIQNKNIEQVHQLLQLLEKNPKSPEITYHGCDSLFSLLYFNGDGTKQSMVHLDSLKIINVLLEKVGASFFFSLSFLSFFIFFSPRGPNEHHIPRSGIFSILDSTRQKRNQIPSDCGFGWLFLDALISSWTSRRTLHWRPTCTSLKRRRRCCSCYPTWQTPPLGSGRFASSTCSESS